MMTRAEFNAYWLPLLNKLARQNGQDDLLERNLDGIWHNYLMQNDPAYHAMVVAALESGKSLDNVRRVT